MRIALDISPIEANSKSAHKVRGVGKYISLLKDNLEKFDKKNTYIYTSDPEKENSDLIHYPYFDPFFITLPFRKRRRTIVTVHDLIPLAHRKFFPVGVKGEMKWRLNKQLLRMANQIITDSKASKDEIHKIVGIENQKITPVYLASDPEYRHLNLTKEEKKAVIQKMNLPDKFVLYVGDVTWNKNLPILVEAVKQANIPIVMIGKALTENNFDKKNPWNQDRIIVASLTDKNPLFIKLGFVDNKTLNLLYNCAQLLCMPSLDEGFGLPALEAMQAGCPVLLSRNGSLPEVGGEAALYIDSENKDDISEKIVSMVVDNDRKKEQAAKGLAQAKKFTIEKFVKETVNVYESLV